MDEDGLETIRQDNVPMRPRLGRRKFELCAGWARRIRYETKHGFFCNVVRHFGGTVGGKQSSDDGSDESEEGERQETG